MLLDMALDISLEEFRRRWEAEIREVTERSEHGVSVKRRRSGEGSDNEDVCEERAWRRLPGSPQREVEEVDNGYLELAERLLEDKPKCTPRDVERPCCIPLTDKPISSFPARAAGNSLVDQLICDLNDINEIPFFDIQLPYEIALQIFQYLGMTELGRCAQRIPSTPHSLTPRVLDFDRIISFDYKLIRHNVCFFIEIANRATISSQPEKLAIWNVVFPMALMGTLIVNEAISFSGFPIVGNCYFIITIYE
ncbi:F-box/WD repeat-containing protein 8-like [Bombina bombina]|uniref:F-box/WD repeat-containing protein 8-like n=1 Tax=Bombina bombina TaxID=8345 RepID=UPI00235AA8DB|nr:F-box/WD repeat-containing protein 8-like [Bombina bombina]